MEIKLTTSINGTVAACKEKKKSIYESEVVSQIIQEINKRINIIPTNDKVKILR